MTYSLEQPEGKPLVFRNAAALEEWAQKEQQHWDWLTQAANAGNHVWGSFRTILQQIRDLAREVKEKPDDENSKASLRHKFRELQDRVTVGSFILSGSRLGVFVKNESDADPIFAANIVDVAIKQDSVQIDRHLGKQLALCAYSDFLRGLSKRGATATAKRLDELVSDQSANLENLTSQSEAKLAEFEQQISDSGRRTKIATDMIEDSFREIAEKTEKVHTNILAESDGRVANFMENSETRLDEFEDAIKTKMSLRAPVEYWQNKRDWHRRATVLLGAVFLAASIVAADYLYDYVVSYKGGAKGFFEFWKSANLAAFAAFGTFLAVGLAFLRILYRMFASQLHLWNDCSERVTMIQTYLALAEKGHAKNEFLGGLLARLFTPASDGVVKDDFGSIGPIDFVTKNLTK